QLDELLDGLAAVRVLRPVATGVDGQDAICPHASARQPDQPATDLVWQHAAAAGVEPQPDRRCDPVNVLAPGARRSNEIVGELPLVDRHAAVDPDHRQNLGEAGYGRRRNTHESASRCPGGLPAARPAAIAPSRVAAERRDGARATSRLCPSSAQTPQVYPEGQARTIPGLIPSELVNQRPVRHDTGVTPRGVPAVRTMSDRPPPRLRQPDRQRVLPAMALEDLLETDHQARVVWDFCLGLDLQPLYERIRSRE